MYLFYFCIISNFSWYCTYILHIVHTIVYKYIFLNIYKKKNKKNSEIKSNNVKPTRSVFALLSQCYLFFFIWCDCLDSPILLTWTSRLKETLLSADFRSETEVPVESGCSKSTGELQASPSLKNSVCWTSSIFPSFHSQS